MKINVGVSKRHVHLNKEVYFKLFGENELLVRNNLSQPGQYASDKTITIKWNDKVINDLRIVGPLRPYNQVELSLSDANILGLNPPRRKSGDLNESLPIILIGPLGEVFIEEGVILAQKHIHLDPDTAKLNNLIDEELVSIFKDNNKLFDANVKVSKQSATELHIDTDEALEYGLNQNDKVDLIKCGK